MDFTISVDFPGYVVRDGERIVANIRPDHKQTGYMITFPGVRGIFNADTYDEALTIACKDSGRMTGISR